MLIDNTLNINVYEYDYSVEYSYDWYRLGNGKYTASDRGEKYDHYETKIITNAEDNEIETILEYLNDKSELTFTNVLTPIFGNNVDYSQPIVVVMQNLSTIEQTSLNRFEIEFSVSLVSCEFLEDFTGLPELTALNHNYVKGNDYSNTTISSYNRENNDYMIIDIVNGVFTGTFFFCYDELAQLQHYQRTVRSLSFPMPTIDGVQYPFGRLNGDTNLQGRLYSVEDITEISMQLYTAKLTIVQD